MRVQLIEGYKGAGDYAPTTHEEPRLWAIVKILRHGLKDHSGKEVRRPGWSKAGQVPHPGACERVGAYSAPLTVGAQHACLVSLAKAMTVSQLAAP